MSEIVQEQSRFFLPLNTGIEYPLITEEELAEAEREREERGLVKIAQFTVADAPSERAVFTIDGMVSRNPDVGGIQVLESFGIELIAGPNIVMEPNGTPRQLRGFFVYRQEEVQVVADAPKQRFQRPFLAELGLKSLAGPIADTGGGDPE